MTLNTSRQFAIKTMQNLAHELGKEQFSRPQFKGSFLLSVHFWIDCGRPGKINVDRTPDHVLEVDGTLGWSLLSQGDLLESFFRSSLSSKEFLYPLAAKIHWRQMLNGAEEQAINCGFKFDLELKPCVLN